MKQSVSAGSTLCTECLRNPGLRAESKAFAGSTLLAACPVCGAVGGRELTASAAIEVMRRFFQLGSVPPELGDGASVLGIVPAGGDGTLVFDDSLQPDYLLLAAVTGHVARRNAPALWRLGRTDHYEPLGEPGTEDATADEIVRRLVGFDLSPETTLYRVRRDVEGDPRDPSEFDTAPITSKSVFHRFDSANEPVFYASMDVETCIHECRTTVADHVVLATLQPTRHVRLANLIDGFDEPPTARTPFETIDRLLAHLCQTGECEYVRCRTIARAIRRSGFEGIIYRSYFSQAKGQLLRNIAIFGRPVSADILQVVALNRVRLERVEYQLRFGPAIYVDG